MNKLTLRLICCLIPSQKVRKNLWNKYFPKRLSPKMGKYTYADPSLLVNQEGVEIGSYCSIAAGVVLGPGQHPTSFLSTHPFISGKYMKGFPGNVKAVESSKPQPVKVGNDVWIGLNAIVNENVIVGDGAIIAAGAVVTIDVPPYAIVGGVPAKVIKYRFDKEIIEQLLKLKWWNLPEDEIRNLPFDNVEECVRILREKHPKMN